MEDVKKLSDEELVDVIRSQNQELFKELMQRYQNKLLRYASYFVRDQEKAEDVVQEAFIKTFINLQGFNTKKKFSSWIYRIVHNEAINQIKRSKKEISLESNLWIREKLVDDTNLEEDFVRKQAREILILCLEELPLIYRVILTLFYLEEKSYEEISDILRIPVGTVGARINRGKKIMRKIWQQEGSTRYVKE